MSMESAGRLVPLSDCGGLDRSTDAYPGFDDQISAQSL
jgi:hypothetical protein